MEKACKSAYRNEKIRPVADNHDCGKRDAAENGKNGIRVNGIAPGLVKTDFAKALWDNPEALAATEKRLAMRRIGEPEDIAGAAIYLSSPAAKWTTGQTIVVDGGAMI